MRLLMFLFGLGLLLVFPGLAAAGSPETSSWLDFREARIRLILKDGPVRPGEPLGAIEIRLAPGYKTYWRSVGDSGVPPTADFQGSEGLADLALAFPFPSSFDDGAGGKAWGYVDHVMLPILGTRAPGKARLAMKLDFAICGTMCIPLHGEIQLNAGKGSRDPQAMTDLARFVAMLPRPVDEPAQLLARSGTADSPVWTLSVAHPGGAVALSAFAEADGYIETKAIAPHEPGRVAIILAGQPSPGKGGRFGPVRLTFGTHAEPREIMLALDEMTVAP